MTDPIPAESDLAEARRIVDLHAPCATTSQIVVANRLEQAIATALARVRAEEREAGREGFEREDLLIVPGDKSR